MTRKLLILPVLAAVALASGAPGAPAQDTQPPDPDAPPLAATLEAPKALTKKQLKKGFTVTVGCDLTCYARFTLTSRRLGIITTRSERVEAGSTKKVKLRSIPLYTNKLRKGEKIQVALDARSEENAGSQHFKKIRVKG